jgi:hypothetical protein
MRREKLRVIDYLFVVQNMPYDTLFYRLSPYLLDGSPDFVVPGARFWGASVRTHPKIWVSFTEIPKAPTKLFGAKYGQNCKHPVWIRMSNMRAALRYQTGRGYARRVDALRPGQIIVNGRLVAEPPIILVM